MQGCSTQLIFPGNPPWVVLPCDPRAEGQYPIAFGPWDAFCYYNGLGLLCGMPVAAHPCCSKWLLPVDVQAAAR